MLEIIPFAQLMIAAFWAILFLQSGLDKITDWSGNLGWLKGHFKESPLSSLVPMMLGSLTLVELGAGILSGLGAVLFLLNGELLFIQYGVQVSTLALVMLFFGQRLAKDYEGAASIAMYFGVALISLFFLS